MSKIGSMLLQSANEALAFAKGEPVEGTKVHVPAEIDVRAIRKDLNMTQAAFAAAYGFPLTTLRDWEQNRARPDTSARAYLLVIARRPDAVADALQPLHDGPRM